VKRTGRRRAAPASAGAVRVLLTPDAEPIPRTTAAVIVDVLRATSALSFALANGAAGIRPAATPGQALAMRDRDREALLCGERDGRILPGFDLGNSPAEYAREVVAGRTLIFASTNGSIAMLAARRARRRVLGAFVNATAVVSAVAAEPRVSIVCAGMRGGFGLEDAGFAGWLVRALEARGTRLEGAAARLAAGLAPRDGAEVRAMLEGSVHGRYLRSLGGEFLRDVARCAEIDVLDRAFEV